MTADVREVEIIQNRGHWIVYVNGEFFCTADSYLEAAKEVSKYYRN